MSQAGSRDGIAIMNWHIFHHWSKWQDLERARWGRWDVQQQKEVVCKEVMIQIRECPKCGKKQSREINL